MLATIINQGVKQHYAALQQTGHTEWDMTKFRASDAGRCRLMRYYKRQGKEKKLDEKTLRFFETGNMWHTWLETLLDEQGLLITKELEVVDDYRIGHIDAIIGHPENGRILYDFKFVSGKKFWYLMNHGQNGDTHYHYQVVTYLLMLPEFMTPDDARIAYISKDDLGVIEVPVPVERFRLHVIEDWDRLFESWDAQQEPVANPQSWECKYCPYHDSCSSAERMF